MNQDDNQFQQLAQSCPDAIFIGIRGRFVYLNPAALRLFGAASADQLLGQPFIERIHPDDRAIVAARVAGLYERGESPPPLEETYLRLDGTPVAVEVSAVPFRYDGENGGLVFVRDITERKRSQEVLRLSEERWKFALEGAGDGVWDWNVETGELYLSQQEMTVLGFDGEGATCSHIDERVARMHPEDKAQRTEAIQKYLSGEAPGYVCEFRTRARDGRWKWVLARGMLVSRTADGKPLRMIGTHSDITERKHVQDEIHALNLSLEQRVEARTLELQAKEALLREALALNENILMTTAMGILAYRQDGQCVLANPAAATLIGGSQAQLLQQNFRRLASWQEAGFSEAAERVLTTGTSEELEAHFTSTFGRDVCVTAQFSRFVSGSQQHLLLMLHDVTERHMAAQALAEREQAFRTLADNVPDNIVRYDLEGRVLYLNPTLERTLGRAAGELLGKAPHEVLPDGRYDALERTVLQVGATGESAEIEQIVPGQDGQPRYHSIRIVPELGPDGRPVSVLAVGRDLTEQKTAEEELRLAASVFHNSAEGVLISDAAGTIVSVNPAFSEITGYAEAEALGKTPRLLRSDRQGPEFYRSMWAALISEGRWQGEIWNRKMSGEAYLEWLTINRIDDQAGNPVRYVSVFHDITEMRRKDERIHHLAFHDALTGLPNRTLMLDRLQHAVERSQRENCRLSVIFIDLDRFKSVNDGLGHDIGDLLLQKVAQRIKGRLRAMDTVARLGGDEFVVLMEDLKDAEYCATLAQELIAAIARPMELRQHTVEIGASMGMAFFPEDGTDPLELMKRADMAMYAAKAAGRNTYRFFQQDMLERTNQRLTLEMDLRRAITNGDLELHYQPKVALATGKLLGVEALVRWRHPDRGLVLPSDFIPLAEESGLIVDLGAWVLDAACRQVAAWQARGCSIKVAVNVSARQLDAGDLVERIAERTARYGLAPADLEIELTESTVMANPDSVAGLLARLRQLGVTVAVDDFGTGYSSLAYLRRLPIDVLKIDRSFVMAADRDEEDAQIVKTVLALGQALKLRVVAEGIETRRQARLLLSLGCEAAQGYLFSRPLPAAELEAWLEGNTLGGGGQSPEICG